MSDGTICMYSVESLGGRIFAIVPDGSWRALDRLKADDPVWAERSVSFHWAHSIDPKAHLKLRDRIKFVYRAA